ERIVITTPGSDVEVSGHSGGRPNKGPVFSDPRAAKKAPRPGDNGRRQEQPPPQVRRTRRLQRGQTRRVRQGPHGAQHTPPLRTRSETDGGRADPSCSF